MTIARHIRGLASLWRSEFGSAMVEFSLIAPFLLTLALGMFGFGRFIYQYQLVVEGLRDAGRYIARFDPTQWDPADYTIFEDQAANLAMYGNKDGTPPARVEGWDVRDDIVFDTTVIDNAAGTYRGGANIRVIEVSTTFTYDDLGLLAALGIGPIRIEARHEQRVIGE